MFRGFPWQGVVMFMFLAYAFLGVMSNTESSESSIGVGRGFLLDSVARAADLVTF